MKPSEVSFAAALCDRIERVAIAYAAMEEILMDFDHVNDHSKAWCDACEVFNQKIKAVWRLKGAWSDQ